MKSVLFNYKWILWLGLLLIPYIYLRYKMGVGNRVAYAPLQFKQVKNWKSALFYSGFIFEALAILCLLIAFAGPHTITERNLIQEEGLDVALVLDVSASMQAQDFKPNRLEAMKEIAKEFINKSGGNRIGVYIFAQDTFTQTPFTTDHKILLDLMEGISFNVIDHSESGGTAIGDALLSATDGLLGVKLPKRDQVIILITDGENSYGLDPILAAKNTLQNNIRLYVIGMAGAEPVKVYVDGNPFLTPSGDVLVTSLDDKQLIEIAEAGEGKYFRAKSNNVLAEILDGLSKLEKTPIDVRKSKIKFSYAPQFALAGFLFFMLLVFIEGVFIRRPIR